MENYDFDSIYDNFCQDNELRLLKIEERRKLLVFTALFFLFASIVFTVYVYKKFGIFAILIGSTSFIVLIILFCIIFPAIYSRIIKNSSILKELFGCFNKGSAFIPILSEYLIKRSGIFPCPTTLEMGSSGFNKELHCFSGKTKTGLFEINEIALGRHRIDKRNVRSYLGLVITIESKNQAPCHIRLWDKDEGKMTKYEKMLYGPLLFAAILILIPCALAFSDTKNCIDVIAILLLFIFSGICIFLEKKYSKKKFQNITNSFSGELIDKYFKIEVEGNYDEAKKILTPELVSYLLDLKKAFGARNVNFLYSEKYVVATISLPALNAFRTNGFFYSFLGKDGIGRIYRQMKASMNFIEYMDAQKEKYLKSISSEN